MFKNAYKKCLGRDEGWLFLFVPVLVLLFFLGGGFYEISGINVMAITVMVGGLIFAELS